MLGVETQQAFASVRSVIFGLGCGGPPGGRLGAGRAPERGSSLFLGLPPPPLLFASLLHFVHLQLALSVSKPVCRRSHDIATACTPMRARQGPARDLRMSERLCPLSKTSPQRTTSTRFSRGIFLRDGPWARCWTKIGSTGAGFRENAVVDDPWPVGPPGVADLGRDNLLDSRSAMGSP